MNDIDKIEKIIIRLNQISGWLRAGKESETVRQELFSAAHKACLELSTEIGILAQER